MIIKFTNYTDGIHYFDFEEPAKNLGLGEELKDTVKLHVKMDKSHWQIVCECTLELTAEFICDRCDADYTTQLQENFTLVYLFDNQQKQVESLNLYYISPEADKINLREDVIDYARLAIPMKRLCNEDCKGLCPSCGADLNKETCKCTKEEVNPVWAPLFQKKNNSNKKE